MLSVALVVAVLAACGSTAPDSTPDAPAGGTVRAAKVTKVLVIVEENHSLDEMSSEMPYTFRQARKYGYATRFTALTHPSLPNYLAIAGGSMFGVTDDDPPANHPVSGESVFGQALDLGKTATLYAEGMPGNCSVADGGDRYAVRHNPWAYFVDEQRRCRQHDVSSDTFTADAASGSLPNAGMLIPNTCNDAHDSDCTLGDADRWMRGHLGAVLAGPDFASGHLLVVVTADEDDRSQDNRVLTAVLHPSQRHHVVTAPLSPYSLTRLYEEVLGVPFLGEAATAPDLAKAFGLPVPAP